MKFLLKRDCITTFDVTITGLMLEHPCAKSRDLAQALPVRAEIFFQSFIS